jgi:Ca2+/Na+ antiporter
MPPLFAALITAGLTAFFFALVHKKVAKPWLRNILIILATLFCLLIGGMLAGSNERAQLTGQIYFVVIVIVYLIWKYVLKNRFENDETLPH